MFKIACWPKHVFVKRPKARYAATEQLVAVFSPLDQLQFESLPNCVPFVKSKL